ncbi:hypothetical protein D3C75_722620 [compost metagenome]
MQANIAADIAFEIRVGLLDQGGTDFLKRSGVRCLVPFQDGDPMVILNLQNALDHEVGMPEPLIQNVKLGEIEQILLFFAHAAIVGEDIE